MPAKPPSVCDVALESKVAFLRQPSSYPAPTYRVEALETHMSWVFLTDRHAYKLKKPMRVGPLNFSSVEMRRFYCEEEVRLNRRLAPDVYLGTVALRIAASGHLALAGDGQIVDWLVRMRRLPSDRMLDYLIRTGAARDADMERIAARLAGFYRTCVPAPIDAAEYCGHFERDIAENRRILRDPAYQLPAQRIDRLCSVQLDWLRHIAALLAQRVRDGRIVEGHGDLRAEHVCMEETPVIIDCLEFAPELRTTDMADEIAFLALECERLGAAGLGRRLLDVCTRLCGDAPDAALVHFYQCMRASMRARITIRHLDEERFRYSAEWPRRTIAYLDLAERHAQAGMVRTPAVS